MQLWKIYNQRILESTSSSQRIITHYEAYFRDPRAELRRVLNFLGLGASEDALEECGSLATQDLRNNLCTTQQLQDARVLPDVFDLYLRMCEEAEFDALSAQKMEMAS